MLDRRFRLFWNRTPKPRIQFQRSQRMPKLKRRNIRERINWAVGALVVFTCCLSHSAYAEVQPLNRPGQSLEDWCSGQANRLAKEANRNLKPSDIRATHYNRILQRCFALTETHDGRTTTALLLDAYANQTYATYFEMENMPLLTLCVLMPDTNEQKTCQSLDELKLFADKFLERPVANP